MQRPLLATLIILLTLAILTACSDPTPAPDPTATPAAMAAATQAPAPTANPTAATAAKPTSSPIPEPTTTPVPDGRLAPIQLQDSESLQSSLSDAELTCIGDDPEQLTRVLTGAGPSSRDEQARLFGCLNDETLARLFLAGFVPGPEPLSESTSECVRAAFDVIDPRAVMTAGIEGDPGRAMAGGMAGFLVTTACLSDEEWEKAGPAAGASDQDRAGGQCLMAELGGSGNMAEAMLAAQKGDITGLALAGTECGLDMEPPPGQPPGTPPPAPTAARGGGHAGLHACENWGTNDRDARDTHSLADPGTIDSDIQPPTPNPDRMPGDFPVEPQVRGNTSDQVQVGSPGLRKDLFGVPLVFSPDVHSEFGSASKTDPRYGSIQRVEIALSHPDGRYGPVHGACESKYGCVALGQLAVVFNLEVQDRQVLLPGPCLWRHTAHFLQDLGDLNQGAGSRS